MQRGPATSAAETRRQMDQSRSAAKPARAKLAQEAQRPAETTAPSAVGPALDPDSPLLKPSQARAKAPARFTVKMETTRGDIFIDVHRDWAPLGADRFYNLVKVGFYDQVAFFRVIDGFMAQTGLHGNPHVNRVWRLERIADDPVKQSNTRGKVSFATSGKNSRTTQFFINFGDNSRLDAMGFAPFGEVRDMKTVDALYSGYGEGAPRGRGPVQMRIQTQGNAYLKADFSKLDYIQKATIEE